LAAAILSNFSHQFSFLYLYRSFDMSLRSRDPSWGVRDLEDVVKAAEDQGLHLVESSEMPANNLILLFRKLATSPWESLKLVFETVSAG
jgi:hypothetical protein